MEGTTRLPNPGTYPAKLSANVVIYEAETGSLCGAFPVRIEGSSVAWAGKHTMVIVKSDGTLQTKNIKTLREIFGWDGQDPFWLEDQDLTGCPFEIVGDHEKYTPQATDADPEPAERTTFKIQWMNPVGGGGARMPESADRKAVLAKYGSKFRANAGTSAAPAKTAAAKPAAQSASAQKPAAKPAAGPAPRRAPGGVKPTATLEEAWTALQKKYGDKSEEEQAEIWYGETEKRWNVTDNSLNPQQCGELLELFSK